MICVDSKILEYVGLINKDEDDNKVCNNELSSVSDSSVIKKLMLMRKIIIMLKIVIMKIISKSHQILEKVIEDNNNVFSDELPLYSYSSFLKTCIANEKSYENE